MKKIFVLSVGQIQLREDLEKFAIISYRDAGDHNLQEIQHFCLPANESIKNHKNILFIEANDVEVTTSLKFKLFFRRQGIPIKLFNTELAKEIIEFAKTQTDKDIIVQCVYGRSRSLTTAMFLADEVLNSTHELEHNEFVIRNHSIMRYLKEALFLKKQ